MAIKKSQLYSTLWEGCNALRGSMDASQYKDYVLIVLFVKYLSDKAGQPGFRLSVPDGCRFADFVALKQNPHIGEEINKKLEAIKEANVRQIGDLALPNFNDPAKLGTGTTMVRTLSRLIAVFEDENLDFSRNRAADDDLLGDAYEYLINKFAVESGKSKGQSYTPAEVSRIIAKVLRINELDRAANTIYDPTCGSGSLLLRALAEASNPNVSLRGQEKDSTTASLAKLNMVLHGISNADIKVGDVLGDPKFLENGMLKTFDICVANPPFSQKNWMASVETNDAYGRWSSELLPPAKCGDYAFLLHLIRSMKPEVGRGACILPHGVMFRGNAEYVIRRQLVRQHLIKGIIGLPPNIFFGTGIPASIIIIDKSDRFTREGIFFIDAKDGFVKNGAKNRLREQDIKRIVDAWEAQEPIDHFCRMVAWSEIEQNDFNLNIPRYVHPRDAEIHHDLQAHLHGGLPAYDVQQMQPIWNACPSLRETLFAPCSNGFFSLRIDKADINAAIEADASYRRQGADFAAVLSRWKENIAPRMRAIGLGASPKELIALWAADLFEQTHRHASLVDAYDVYDAMMNFWAETMQDDCYMIANDGWTLPPVRAVKIEQKKDDNTGEVTKTKETKVMYDDIQCDLVPVHLVLSEYFSAETAAISVLSTKVDAKQAEMDDLVEQKLDTFNFSDEDVDPDKGLSPKEADVKKAVKNANTNGLSAAELDALNSWLQLNKEKKDLAKKLRQQRTALTIAVVEKYAALTEDDIKLLVVDRKWLATIVGACEALMQSVTHRIGTEVTALVERYEHPLPELLAETAACEKAVNKFLAQMGFNL